MNFRRFSALLATGIIAGSVLFLLPLSAKPPAPKEAHKPAAIPTPAVTPDDTSIDPLIRWLLEQDGQPRAITLPLGQIIHAATGKRVVPFDAANPADTAFLAKLGAIMDRVLPRQNRPDSTAHAAARLDETDEIAARFEDEIRAAACSDSGAFVIEADAPNADLPTRGYPALRLQDATTRKEYYLAVTLYPTGKREEATRNPGRGRALRFDPAAAVQQIPEDGCYLLVGVEHNGKKGNDIAFLNWDVVDVANLPVRMAVTFDAAGADVYHPGAVLTDGRKGSD